MKSYYIYTYGCQMNTADSERLSHQLESVGYTPTEDVETADLILLNTCAMHPVTARIKFLFFLLSLISSPMRP